MSLIVLRTSLAIPANDGNKIVHNYSEIFII